MDSNGLRSFNKYYFPLLQDIIMKSISTLPFQHRCTSREVIDGKIAELYACLMMLDRDTDRCPFLRTTTQVFNTRRSLKLNLPFLLPIKNKPKWTEILSSYLFKIDSLLCPKLEHINLSPCDI